MRWVVRWVIYMICNFWVAAAIVLIYAKVTHQIEWPWIGILFPVWSPLLIVIMFGAINYGVLFWAGRSIRRQTERMSEVRKKYEPQRRKWN